MDKAVDRKYTKENRNRENKYIKGQKIRTTILWRRKGLVPDKQVTH